MFAAKTGHEAKIVSRKYRICATTWETRSLSIESSRLGASVVAIAQRHRRESSAATSAATIILLEFNVRSYQQFGIARNARLERVL
jgi:hypothetical protein